MALKEEFEVIVRQDRSLGEDCVVVHMTQIQHSGLRGVFQSLKGQGDAPRVLTERELLTLARKDHAAGVVFSVYEQARLAVIRQKSREGYMSMAFIQEMQKPALEKMSAKINKRLGIWGGGDPDCGI